ncbi:MAG: hypothetical protein JO359_02750, partial [Candidatus Eremiobacteraeota bacterium]|nr:hypothetical protein [Candidatus Eremiobacteraeota bacterium]
MRSLRARLTLIYAILSALALGIVVLLIVQLAFRLCTAPLRASVHDTAANANAIAAADP